MWDGGQWILDDGPCQVCLTRQWMAEDLERVKQRIIQRYKLDQGELENMRFDTYQPQNDSQQAALLRAKTIVQAWKQGNWRKGLMLYSQVKGVGKTHLAISMAREGLQLMKDYGTGPLLVVWPVPSFMNALKNSFNYKEGEPGQTTAQLMYDTTQARILLLDDLGVEHYRSESWYQETFYDVINHRWVNQLATLVTTNASPKVLERRLGDAVMSRLMALVGEPVIMEGKDYRIRRT